MSTQTINPRRDFLKKSVTGAVALGVGAAFTGALLESSPVEAATSANFNPEVPVAHNEKNSGWA